MKRVSILGASGYAGGELIRLVDSHPELDAVHLGAHSQHGQQLADVHPHLEGGERVLGTLDVPEGVEVAFLALPHGASHAIGPALANKGLSVFDLGSDFRLDTPSRYTEAYGEAHEHIGELADWVYGLAELAGDDLIGARRVAVPGCYPTAAVLAVAPLVAAGLIDTSSIVIDALSGVSGAGRKPASSLSFGSIDQSVKPYAVGQHRHRPEIEMGIELATGAPASVVFTPHLVPMVRGLLATVTAPALTTTSRAEVLDVLTKHYASAPLVSVIDQAPETHWVVGSARALVTAYVDRDRIIAVCAIDNLLKGAASQAVQCANIAFEWDETTGLPQTGFMP